MRTPPDAVVTRELAVIRRAYGRVVQALERAEPEVAFQAASSFTRSLRELYEQDATRLVARMAVRLRAARSYSLAELARAVDVSKSMAAYWDRRARKEAQP